MQSAQLKNALSNDNVFNCINKHFTSLPQENIKINNEVLLKVNDTVIRTMKGEDTLFQKLYQRIIFGGSFYKGTRVGAPTEYDLDVVIKLPMKYNVIQFHSCQPGYTRIYVGSNPYIGNFTPQELKLLNTFIENGYLNQARFRRWIESIMSKVLYKLPDYGGAKLLMEYGNTKYTIRTCKSGPAFTIFLRIGHKEEISIDLVPALAFTESLEILHMRSLRKFRNDTWLAVPKPLTESGYVCIENIYWRFSFYYQEKEVLGKYGRVKPVIRQMKKLRDVQQWKSIISYYIETLFLNELENLKDLDKMPFTLLFYMMLKKLYEACANRELQYYWDKNYNLLQKIQPIEASNIAGRLNFIIKDIEKNIITDPYAIAKFLLTPNEMQLLKCLMAPESDGEYVRAERLTNNIPVARVANLNLNATQEENNQSPSNEQWCTIA